MCDKSCLTAERGTKIFAYFNLVLVVLSFLVAYGVAIFYVMIFVAYHVNDSIMIIFLALIFLGPIISVMFAVILFVGVRNEKPTFLLIYIIYGILVILLSVVCSFLMTFVHSACFISLEDVCDNPPVFGGVFLVCGIYSIVLFMIGKTYRQLQTAHCRGFKHISPEMNFTEKKDLLYDPNN